MSHAEDTHDKLDAWWTARYATLEAHVAELERERDEHKRQAALYHADMMNVREQRDAAHAETRDMQLRLTRVVDGSKVMRAKLATAVEALRKISQQQANRFQNELCVICGHGSNHLCEGCIADAAIAAIEAAGKGEP